MNAAQIDIAATLTIGTQESGGRCPHGGAHSQGHSGVGRPEYRLVPSCGCAAECRLEIYKHAYCDRCRRRCQTVGTQPFTLRAFGLRGSRICSGPYSEHCARASAERPLSPYLCLVNFCVPCCAFSVARAGSETAGFGYQAPALMKVSSAHDRAAVSATARSPPAASPTWPISGMRPCAAP